jgi:AcrR family transcriptional regulator
MATQSQRREKTRQLLLQAAEEAFTSRGFHGVSLDAIAESAGLSKGAVYGRFGSKDGLFLAVVEQRFEQRLGELVAAWSQEADLEDSLVATLVEQSRRLGKDSGWAAAWLEFVVHATRDEETLADLRELDQRLVRGAARTLAARSELGDRDGDFLTSIALLIGSGQMVERLLAPKAVTDAHIERLARALAHAVSEGENHEH